MINHPSLQESRLGKNMASATNPVARPLTPTAAWPLPKRNRRRPAHLKRPHKTSPC